MISFEKAGTIRQAIEKDTFVVAFPE